MRIRCIGLWVGIPAVSVCVLLLLYQHFETEIGAFLHSLRLYGAILVPIAFVIGILLFIQEKGSILSTLSLLCLIIMVVSAYGYFLVSVTPGYEENPDPEARLIRMFIAEFGIFLLMITSAVKSCQKEKQE